MQYPSYWNCDDRRGHRDAALLPRSPSSRRWRYRVFFLCPLDLAGLGNSPSVEEELFGQGRLYRASGWLMMAKVRRRLISDSYFDKGKTVLHFKNSILFYHICRPLVTRDSPPGGLNSFRGGADRSAPRWTECALGLVDATKTHRPY